MILIFILIILYIFDRWRNNIYEQSKFNLHLIKGAGTGALGIAAAAFGAHVMLTDIKDQIELMKINVKENEEMIKAKSGSVCINEWNWGNFSNEQTKI